jgi:hypothetical protein
MNKRVKVLAVASVVAASQYVGISSAHAQSSSTPCVPGPGVVCVTAPRPSPTPAPTSVCSYGSCSFGPSSGGGGTGSAPEAEASAGSPAPAPPPPPPPSIADQIAAGYKPPCRGANENEVKYQERARKDCQKYVVDKMPWFTYGAQDMAALSACTARLAQIKTVEAGQCPG